MEQDRTSFWNDIKRFEDILAKDPASYCFAQLSELYRGLGLVDDAIAAAKRGCDIHPEFISGILALARACLDKGMKEESVALLARVVRATPENSVALKLLVGLYLESGELAAAEQTLRAGLLFHPEDGESRELLATLAKTARRDEEPTFRIGEQPEQQAGEFSVEEVAEEDLFVLDDEDLLEYAGDEEAAAAGAGFDVVPQAEPPVEEELPHKDEKDPLTTGTLAELYVAQGFIDRALSIYRELLVGDPANTAITERVRELEQMLQPEEGVGGAIAEQTEAVGAPPVAEPFNEVPAPEREKSVESTLNGWLDNITRRRKWLSGRS